MAHHAVTDVLVLLACRTRTTLNPDITSTSLRSTKPVAPNSAGKVVGWDVLGRADTGMSNSTPQREWNSHVLIVWWILSNSFIRCGTSRTRWDGTGKLDLPISVTRFGKCWMMSVPACGVSCQIRRQSVQESPTRMRVCVLLRALVKCVE